jgi:hypothetical protein
VKEAAREQATADRQEKRRVKRAESPHECQLCHEKFATVGSLNRHVRSVVSAGKAVVWC